MKNFKYLKLLKIGKMNKKGIEPVTIGLAIFFIVFLLFGISGGWLISWKLKNIVNSIPTWVWFLLIFLFIAFLLRRKK